MVNRVINYLRRQSFQPSVLALFLNPFYFIRRPLYIKIKLLAPNLSGNLLDFGCGRKPYGNLFHNCNYTGVDIETSGHDHRLSKVDVFYDGKHLPFQDGSFDSLFCSEVFEHVFDIDETLVEINRVLKTGAKALITIPFAWNEHEIPYDYARYSSFGIRYLLQKHGFKIIDLQKTGNFSRVIWQFLILYIFEFFKRFKKIGFVLSLIIIIPLNIIGFFLLPLSPRNKSLFFNNVVVAEKING
ncbi:MAG: hypothetical protein NVS9B7_11300 [Flavisolibacter sp.]